MHIYPDEMATVALSMLLRRPVKFVADRLESFVTDIHARDHRVKARIAVNADGEITAFEIDDLTGIGPYSVYPRTSGIEANQVVNLTGAPYRRQLPRPRPRRVPEQERDVPVPRGRPSDRVAVTEGWSTSRRARARMDPVEIRRRNLIADDAYPHASPSGIKFERLSHHRALAKLLEMMDYEGCAPSRRAARSKASIAASACQLHRGDQPERGLLRRRRRAHLGAGRLPDARLDASGAVVVQTSVTEQGQGTEAIMAQVVATRVRRADRAGPGDHRRHRQHALRRRHLGLARRRHRRRGGAAGRQGAARERARGGRRHAAGEPESLDIRNGKVVDAATGASACGSTSWRASSTSAPTRCPKASARADGDASLRAAAYPFAFTNGIQASYLEVDVETGFVKLLKHWVVEDCGTIINPQLVDEQIRGGVVQGIGGALFEHCIYDANGQLLNGTMADYLVPMAAEMPDIEVGHVVTPDRESELGAKGAGEAGTAGAPGAVMNAINDALVPFAVTLTTQPATPERILRALGKVDLTQPSKRCSRRQEHDQDIRNQIAPDHAANDAPRRCDRGRRRGDRRPGIRVRQRAARSKESRSKSASPWRLRAVSPAPASPR